MLRISHTLRAALFAAPLVAATALPVLAQTYPAPSNQAPTTQRTAKRNDAYRPPADQPGLGTLGGTSGQSQPSYGSAPPSGPVPNYEPPSYAGGPYNASSPPPYIPPYGQGAAEPQSYSGQQQDSYRRSGSAPYAGDTYRPAGPSGAYASPSAPYGGQGSYGAPSPYASNNDAFGQPYRPGASYDDDAGRNGQGRRPYMSGEPEPTGSYSGSYGGPRAEPHDRSTFSSDDIKRAGHGFFGSISQGMASVMEHAFRKQGRPNGYILGEDAGGAFVAGLRYGQGTLYTRDAGTMPVYWQGPSIGFDAGGDGSKVMVLVYNLRDPREIFDRFGGVNGSAYVVGGVGLTFQTKDHLVLAPIRSGVGLRLGANVGYLKYTPKPTWNPF